MAGVVIVILCRGPVWAGGELGVHCPDKLGAPVPRQDGKIGIDGHGGDLAAALVRFGPSPDGWIDLSTGINPTPYPHLEVSPDAWARLPQSSALDALKRAAADAYGAAGPDLIACAPGTQAVIQALPRVLGVHRLAILGPTYAEHGAAWRAAGADVTEVSDLPAPDRSLVLVNPNNPDGRTAGPGRLTAWARDAAAAGQWLIIDEAFADVRPDISLVGSLPLANVVVLRSFGKFHGLAGLRLGFALAEPDVVRRLEADLGPWAVAGPAQEIGARALTDHAWAAAERTHLSARMVRLRDLLTEAGLGIVGGTDLFVLTEHGDAFALYDHLGEAGILVRRFATNSKWLRFGLPGPEEHWRRLQTALTAFNGTICVPDRRHG
ncbi:MAG: threonine-phosphate decarboxylase [Rhodospirillaceae bacterium]|nr:threonine-phosphate decarboxylase [Rhodospirillaceae bacterium]